MNYPGWVRSGVALLLVCVPTTVLGSGFGIFTQSASSLGQAAAVVAHGDDPSVIFFNPALLNTLEGTQIQVGTTLLFPSRNYTGAAGQRAETNDDVFYPSTLYLSHRFSERVSVGLGVFSPFGLGTDWGETWEGRYLATNSEMISLAVNPVVSVQVTPQLALAAGLDVIYVDTTLQRMVNTGFDNSQKFKGDGAGIGFNVGAAYAVTSDLSLGVSYRSEVKVDIEGQLQFGVQIPPFGLVNSSARADITLPQQVSAGVCYKGFGPLVLEAGVRWEDWSSYKNLKLSLSNGMELSESKNWKSTFAYNVGANYKLNDTVSLLAGYLYGDNPVPDSTFEPAIPDADTHLFTVGTTLNFSSLRVSLSYAYQLLENRTKNNSLGDPFNPGSGTANGRYSSDLHIVAASMTYLF